MSETKVEPLQLKNCLTIIYSDGTEVKAVCPPRVELRRLRSLFLDLQAIWVEYGFSSADLFTDPQAWHLVEDIARTFKFDAERLDFGQLEALFLTRDRVENEISAYKVDGKMVHSFYIDVFQGAQLLEFCRFEPRLIIQQAYEQYRNAEAQKEKIQQDMESLKLSAVPVAIAEPATSEGANQSLPVPY
jgi:hypothetical protein